MSAERFIPVSDIVPDRCMIADLATAHADACIDAQNTSMYQRAIDSFVDGFYAAMKIRCPELLEENDYLHGELLRISLGFKSHGQGSQ